MWWPWGLPAKLPCCAVRRDQDERPRPGSDRARVLQLVRRSPATLSCQPDSLWGTSWSPSPDSSWGRGSCFAARVPLADHSAGQLQSRRRKVSMQLTLVAAIDSGMSPGELLYARLARFVSGTETLCVPTMLTTQSSPRSRRACATIPIPIALMFQSL